MPYPYRLRVNVVRQSTYGPAGGYENHGRPSPLLEERIIETGFSATTPVVPESRSPRLVGLAREAVDREARRRSGGWGLPSPLYSADFLTTTPDSFGALPDTADAVVSGSSAEFAFVNRQSLASFTLRAYEGTAPVNVYGLGALPVGAEGWFQFTVDPVTSAPFATPRWYRGTVEGTPDEMRVRHRTLGVAPRNYLGHAIGVAPEVIAESTLRTTLLATRVDPAVVEWFGTALTQLAPVGTPTLGAPATFLGPDGIPIAALGVVAELGDTSLNVLARRVLVVAPDSGPVTQPWRVFRC